MDRAYDVATNVPCATLHDTRDPACFDQHIQTQKTSRPTSTTLKPDRYLDDKNNDNFNSDSGEDYGRNPCYGIMTTMYSIVCYNVSNDLIKEHFGKKSFTMFKFVYHIWSTEWSKNVPNICFTFYQSGIYIKFSADVIAFI